MGFGELEVEVVIAKAGDRRRVWVSAIPGLGPGRRLRIDSAGDQQWWRIVGLGQIRLREAAASIEVAI